MHEPINHTPDITQRFLLLRDEVLQVGIVESKGAFAKSVGEYQQNFSLMERGERAPTIKTLVRACEVYGYSANWLFLNIGPKKMDKGLIVPIEKRVSDLELQVRTIKKILSVRQH